MQDNAGEAGMSSSVMFSHGSPSHGRAKAGEPTWIYLQQLCEDMGCSPEDLPEAMNDSGEWRERVRDICAGGTTRWWWRQKGAWKAPCLKLVGQFYFTWGWLIYIRFFNLIWYLRFFDSLILTACRLTRIILCLEVRELYSFYNNIYIFGVVVS